MTKPTKPTKPSQLTLDNAAYVAQAAEIKRLTRERDEAVVDAEVAELAADRWCERAVEAEAEVAERESQITRLEEKLTEILRLVGALVQPAEHD